jgi:hypothetical protein
MAAGLFAAACSSSEESPAPAKTGSGGGTAGDDASAGTGGGNGGDQGGGGVAAGGGGSVITDAALDGPLPACKPVLTTGADPGVIIDFSKVRICTSTGDAGPSKEACWTKWGTIGGTWNPYPAAGTILDNTGSDADPDSGCTTFSTSAMTSAITAGVWTITGTVGASAGFGIWVQPCYNASSFTGIEFTMSGDVGPSAQAFLQVYDFATASYAAATVTTIPAASGAVQVPWTQFTTGLGTAIDPAHIGQIQWIFDWSCYNSAAYNVNVSVTKIRFY